MMKIILYLLILLIPVTAFAEKTFFGVTETQLEAILDLQDLQGAVTDSQLPATVPHTDEENTFAEVQFFEKSIGMGTPLTTESTEAPIQQYKIENDASQEIVGYSKTIEMTDETDGTEDVITRNYVMTAGSLRVDSTSKRATPTTLTAAGFNIEVTDDNNVFLLTIAGLTAARTGTLPAMTGSLLIYKFAILDGDDTHDFILDPDGTDQIIGTSAAGDYLAADDAGDYIEIQDIASGLGLVIAKQGTWTEE